MENFILGTILMIVGFVMVRMLKPLGSASMRPLIVSNHPLIFNVMPTILIISGLWLSFTVGWYFPIIAIIIAPFIATLIRK